MSSLGQHTCFANFQVHYLHTRLHCGVSDNLPAAAKSLSTLPCALLVIFEVPLALHLAKFLMFSSFMLMQTGEGTHEDEFDDVEANGKHTLADVVEVPGAEGYDAANPMVADPEFRGKHYATTMHLRSIL